MLIMVSESFVELVNIKYRQNLEVWEAYEF